MEPKSDSEHLRQLLAHQAKSLDALTRHFVPTHQQEVEQRWKWFIAKMVAFGSILISGLFGGWQFLQYMKEQYDIHQMASRYAEVAKEIYYNENNAEVAQQFLAKASSSRTATRGTATSRLHRRHGRRPQADEPRRPSPRKRWTLPTRPWPTPSCSRASRRSAPNPTSSRARCTRPSARTPAPSMSSSSPSSSTRKTTSHTFAWPSCCPARRRSTRPSPRSRPALNLDAKSKWAWLWKGVILADNRKGLGRRTPGLRQGARARFEVRPGLLQHGLGLGQTGPARLQAGPATVSRRP